jgi:hypothetical protein
VILDDDDDDDGLTTLKLLIGSLARRLVTTIVGRFPGVHKRLSNRFHRTVLGHNEAVLELRTLDS